jgi:peptidoglycan-associated lipoprotein
MNKQFSTALVVSLLLAACTKAVKEEPAKVEDKTPAAQTSTSSSAGDSNAGAADSSGTTTGKVEGSAVVVDPRKDPGNILYQRSVFFDYDKDEVKQEYRALVEAHAKYLVQNPNAKLILQGNTDERGSREYNLALGQRRSVAVKKVMNLMGASDRQIETVSFGEEKQRCAEKAESCWSQNRRADIAYEGE